MPARDIVDMHEIETGVDEPRMRPDAASMMTRPVGVGFWSRGPIGAVGCTMMAGKFSRPINVSTTRSAATLLCL